MTNALIVSNIEWDVRGVKPEGFELPSEVRLENVPEETLKSVSFADEIADLLFETYGRSRYHVNGFSSRLEN